MKNYKWFFLFLLFSFSACNQDKAGFMSPDATEASYENVDGFSNRTSTQNLYDSDGESQPKDARGSDQQAQQPEAGSNLPRKVIKTANIRFRVEDLNASGTNVDQLVEQFGGYVTKLEQNNSNYEWSSEITIRVPADQFDALLNALGNESIYTNYKRIEARDVTEEYYDVETRLKTKREVRDRYVDILRNKAKTVEEILLAEEQIRVIQEEIDSKEGRLRFLKDRVAMSTINLEIYQTVEYTAEPSTYTRSFWKDLGSSFRNGGELLGDLFLGLISIWPLVILILLVIWKGGWAWRKIRG